MGCFVYVCLLGEGFGGFCFLWVFSFSLFEVVVLVVFGGYCWLLVYLTLD